MEGPLIAEEFQVKENDDEGYNSQFLAVHGDVIGLLAVGGFRAICGG
jgi:hypothetical protein